MGMKPRKEPEPLYRTRVRVDFTIQHREWRMMHHDWIDVVVRGLDAAGDERWVYIEPGAKIVETLGKGPVK